MMQGVPNRQLDLFADSGAYDEMRAPTRPPPVVPAELDFCGSRLTERLLALPLFIRSLGANHRRCRGG